jgi:threonine dehydrogenase-like Zn-dependent dehydrogenase
MRAVAVFPGERALRLVEHPEPPAPARGEALLRMLDVGVCGTDREIAHFDYGTPPEGSPYLVLGHESLARVIEVGSDVRTVAKNDLVVTTVRRPCQHPECRACATGRQDFCLTGDFKERGIKQRHGFMTELVLDDERYMQVVPQPLRDVGVLVEPLTIAEKALRQVWDVQDRLPWGPAIKPDGDGHGLKALVLGAGPVGMLGLLALQVRGFETYMYSTSPADGEKALWVESVGGRYLPAKAMTREEVREQIGNIDLIYEATGVPSTSFEMLEILGVNGVFVFTGVPPQQGPIPVNASQVMRSMVLKNQVVLGTVNAAASAFEAAVADLAQFDARWPAPLRHLITGRYPPEQIEDLLIKPSFGIKRVVRFAES